MKKVAATSGQSVSFATLFVEGIAREGNWAGRDKVLNCLPRPPKAFLALSLPRKWSECANAEYGKIFPMQEKYAWEAKIFLRGNGAAEENRAGLCDRRFKTEERSFDSDPRPPKCGGRDKVARVSAQDDGPRS
jgi:hypothetical protein